LGANVTIGDIPFNNVTPKPTIWCYATNTATVNYAKNQAIPYVLMLKDIALDSENIGLNTTTKKTATLTVSYDPVDPTSRDYVTESYFPVEWKTSDSTVASVSSSAAGTATVTAKKLGVVTITATVRAQSGDKVATCNVVVAEPASITAFELEGVAGVITEGADGLPGTIDATLPAGTNLSSLTPVVTHNSTNVSNPDPITPTGAQDFRNPIIYTVTEGTGDTAVIREYTVTAKLAYDVTVTNGTGSGSYVSGATVDITANAPTSGKVFDKWTSEDVTFDNANSANTSFVMPAQAVTVTATYKDAPVTPPPATTTYAVTVVSGSDGANGTYLEGATVNITANTPASGKVFDKWTSNDGVTFANASNSATSFVMPAKDVTVTATYKDEPVDPPVNPPVDPPTADNGWVHANGVWKYFVDGVAKTGWVYDQNKWYFTNAAGEMQTGWIYDHNTWYYLAGNGAMKTGWIKDNGSWYYLAGNGAMVASKWLHDTDGSWYYLSGNGKMLTGKQKIGGKVYSFKTNGIWVS
jgi:hypothetical protein